MEKKRLIYHDLTEDEKEILERKFGTKYQFIQVKDRADFQRIVLGRQVRKNDLWELAICKDYRMVLRFTEENIPIIGWETGEKLSCKYVILDLDVLEEKDLEIVYAREKGLPITILETKRCYVRELSLDDIDDLYTLYEHEHMTDYIEPLFDREAELEYEANYIHNIYEFYGYGMWLVFEKGTDELIGRAGVESRESCKESWEVEIGYAIKPSRWNRGFATEVCSAIIDYTFHVLQKKRIIANVDENNKKSVRLMQRLGFSKAPDGFYEKYATNT